MVLSTVFILYRYELQGLKKSKSNALALIFNFFDGFRLNFAGPFDVRGCRVFSPFCFVAKYLTIFFRRDFTVRQNDT